MGNKKMLVVQQHCAVKRVGKCSCEFYHPRSNLSCNKPVGLILTFEWIILHGNHDIHGTYLTCCKSLQGSIKRETFIDFVAKQQNYSLINSLQPATTSFFTRRVQFVGGKTGNTVIELTLQQLMLQIKLHIFLSPFYRIFTHLICVNQMKIIRYTSGL